MTEAFNIARLTRKMEAAAAEGDRDLEAFVWSIICKLQAQYRSKGIFVM